MKNPRCDGLDADEQVLSGYMQMDVQYCQVGDDQLRNDLLNETGDNSDVYFGQYIFLFLRLQQRRNLRTKRRTMLLNGSAHRGGKTSSADISRWRWPVQAPAK